MAKRLESAARVVGRPPERFRTMGTPSAAPVRLDPYRGGDLDGGAILVRIGWQSDWKALQEWWGDHQKGSAPWELLLQHLFGWILTAVAISMGAPFWFDTLNRFMNIRNEIG